jgi:hypothetical protein
MNANLYASARQSLRRFARVAPLLASAMFARCGKTQPALYVMKDLHPFINPRSGRSTVVRKIEDTLRILATVHRPGADALFGPSGLKSVPVPFAVQMASVMVVC